MSSRVPTPAALVEKMLDLAKITPQDLHDKLSASGIEIGKKKIHLFTPVNTLGKHTVKIKLHADVAVELGFDVVSENPIEPVVTEEKPAGEKTEKRAERRPRKDGKE